MFSWRNLKRKDDGGVPQFLEQLKDFEVYNLVETNFPFLNTLKTSKISGFLFFIHGFEK